MNADMASKSKLRQTMWRLMAVAPRALALSVPCSSDGYLSQPATTVAGRTLRSLLPAWTDRRPPISACSAFTIAKATTFSNRGDPRGAGDKARLDAVREHRPGVAKRRRRPAFDLDLREPSRPRLPARCDRARDGTGTPPPCRASRSDRARTRRCCWRASCRCRRRGARSRCARSGWGSQPGSGVLRRTSRSHPRDRDPGSSP